MSKNKLRKIKLLNEAFLWRREHQHLTDFNHSKCVERVVVYLDGYKQSPLQLYFREEDNLMIENYLEKEKWCVGYPNDGVIWRFKHDPNLSINESNSPQKKETIHINFNRPAVIATLIEHFFRKEWCPKENLKPLIIKNALLLLELIELPNEFNEIK